jgi:hypothetical protein
MQINKNIIIYLLIAFFILLIFSPFFSANLIEGKRNRQPVLKKKPVLKKNRQPVLKKNRQPVLKKNRQPVLKKKDNFNDMDSTLLSSSNITTDNILISSKLMTPSGVETLTDYLASIPNTLRIESLYE